MANPALTAIDGAAQPNSRRRFQPIVREIRTPDPRLGMMGSLHAELCTRLFDDDLAIDCSRKEFQATFTGRALTTLENEVARWAVISKAAEETRNCYDITAITRGRDVHFARARTFNGHSILCCDLDAIADTENHVRGGTLKFSKSLELFFSDTASMVSCHACLRLMERTGDLSWEHRQQVSNRKAWQECISLAHRISRIAKSLQLEAAKETIVMEIGNTPSLLSVAAGAADVEKLKKALECTSEKQVLEAACLLFCAASDAERESDSGVKTAASVIATQLGAVTSEMQAQLGAIHAAFKACAKDDR